MRLPGYTGLILRHPPLKKGDEEMHYIAAAGTAVTREAGSIPEMLPKFGVIALAVAIIIIALVIYSKYDKKRK